MLYIVVIACLETDKEACSERYIPVYADVSAMACLMGAQAQIARWMDSHKDLVVSGWRCETEDTIEAASALRGVEAKQVGVSAK